MHLSVTPLDSFRKRVFIGGDLRALVQLKNGVIETVNVTDSTGGESVGSLFCFGLVFFLLSRRHAMRCHAMPYPVLPATCWFNDGCGWVDGVNIMAEFFRLSLIDYWTCFSPCLTSRSIY